MELEQDPVCGVKIDSSECKDWLHTISFKGKDFYVCSPSCAALFTEDPERYLLRNSNSILDNAKDEKNE